VARLDRFPVSRTSVGLMIQCPKCGTLRKVAAGFAIACSCSLPAVGALYGPLMPNPGHHATIASVQPAGWSDQPDDPFPGWSPPAPSPVAAIGSVATMTRSDDGFRYGGGSAPPW
jgi:hypothetical protein